MLYLKSLPLLFFEGLVVCQLAHKTSYFGSEVFLKLHKGGLGVLDGVV
jgi:hypothetical protein